MPTRIGPQAIRHCRVIGGMADGFCKQSVCRRDLVKCGVMSGSINNSEPIAMLPFTPATTILKLSNVPKALEPYGAALRSPRVHVVEMLETFRIFDVTE